MTKKLRNKKIKELSKKFTRKQLANKFKITSERVRQILVDYHLKLPYCKIHKRCYKSYCSLCYLLAYYPKLLKRNHINEEVRLLKKPDRTIETVYARALLVKYLVDNKKMKYSEIGRLLKRDHSTITHLYNKQL